MKHEVRSYHLDFSFFYNSKMKTDSLDQDWLMFCFASFPLKDALQYSVFQPVACESLVFQGKIIEV